MVAGRPIPVLLYADDAVLLARTTIGLQRLMDAFFTFMVQKKMVINKSKTYTMIYGPKLPKTFFIEKSAIQTVTSFCYLGILFMDNGSWSQHVTNIRAKMNRATQGIFKFSSKLGNWPFYGMVALYKAKGASTPSMGQGCRVTQIISSCKHKKTSS